MGLVQGGDAQEAWLAIALGNSRLHWARFESGAIAARGHSPHFRASETTASLAQREWWSGLQSGLPLVVASVVPQQLQLLCQFLPQTSPLCHLTTDSLPLAGLYPGFGVDRGLAGLGAGERWGFPVLVIDGGTALTLTGFDGGRSLVGGAIVPGVALQSRALFKGTALPETHSPLNSGLPSRWALETGEAICSGIIYTLLAGVEGFIQQWRQRFPDSAVVFTGGDGAMLAAGLDQISPELGSDWCVDPEVLFWGMAVMCTLKQDTSK
ncbi:pantothenate kinase [Geitlerinema sp. P-1104]|uniref:pantothenate kinase n=1 Tax=Geitlerinema sp. P-1104 TaxID=2546230 RepID=UPI0014778851|nr:pantothenate kinase [Geitlerinema sp. P-1104]NMG59442.1 pantothenate kinase [Geitlerinema sp. P-1104]